MTKYKVPGHRILVKLFAKEDEVAVSDELKNLGFKVAHEIGMEQREKVASVRGIVLQIGPTAWKHRDYGWPSDDWEPWCKVGDTIIFAQYAGKLYQDAKTGDEVFLINDSDVQLVVEEG